MKQDWNDFALILIDVQQACWSSHTQVAFPRFSTNLASLLSLCRKNEIEVIHLRTEYQVDKFNLIKQLLPPHLQFTAEKKCDRSSYS